MAFDPDQYLTKQKAEPKRFDPDAYLEKPITVPNRSSEVPPARMPAQAEPTPEPPPPFDVAKIPESTAYGAAFGAVTPEVLKYGGRALQNSPFGQPAAGIVGRGMEVSGEALRGRRGLTAASGAVGGGLGETVTQAGLSMGAPSPVAYGAGLLTSMFGPTAIGQVASRTPWLSGLMRKAEEGGYGEAAGRFAAELRKGMPATARAPQEQVVNALEREAQSLRSNAQAEANRILSEAESEISRLAPDATQQANQIREAARQQANNILGQVDRQVAQRQRALREVSQRQQFGEQTRIPEGTRQLIGQPREATDVGTSLRDRVVSVQGNRLQRRRAQADADNAAVAQEVSAKQSANNFVSNLPSYQTLLGDLQARAGVGRGGMQRPLETEVDPGVRKVYQDLFNALRKRQVETADGKVQDLPTSFEAIDNVRRRLGEAYRNPTAEGYGAIGQNAARDLYKQLSEILGEYSPAKRQFMSNYEELSRELDLFRTAAGRKATAVDRFDPERFVTDPAKLPSDYFSTRTAVQDLIELTGNDRRFVENQAASYVARQLENVRTPQSAAEFEARNRDWLLEFPNLRASVDRYINALGFAETRGKRLTEAAKALRTDIQNLPIRAQKEAKGRVTEAEAQAKALEGRTGGISARATKQAAEVKSSAAAQARMLERSPKQDQVNYFDSLISSGDTRALEAASSVIKRDPQLMDSFMQGVKVTLSRMEPTEVVDNYRRLVKPALERLELASASQLRQIDKQIQLIEATTTPELRATFISNVVRNAVAGGGGMGASRLMENLGLSFANPYLGTPDATR